MPVDWSLQLTKKAELQKLPPTSVELRSLEDFAAEILQISADDRGTEWAVSLGYGMRTMTLLTPKAGVSHRYESQAPRVVVKLFRGPAKDFIQFHSHDFLKIPALLQHEEIQQSIDAGVSRTGVSFAVLQFIDGVPLRSRLLNPENLDAVQAQKVLSELFLKIWIPIWDSGLRFKDCHVGNFILCLSAPSLVMIDCEQMRKSAAEFLRDSACWSQRTRHEASAIERLPNLIASVLMATKPQHKQSSLVRMIRTELTISPPDTTPLRYQAPQRFDNRSRAARIQGAAVAMAMRADEPANDVQSWQERCNWSMQAAYYGTESRPTRYPNRSFSATGDWLVG